MFLANAAPKWTAPLRLVTGWLLVLGLTQDVLAQEILIPTGSTWRIRKGTNEVSNPISLWRDRTFTDTSWPTGTAPFHYGESLTGGTLLSDMRGNYTCVFLRRDFVITNVADIQSLNLSVNYDDGFIAWINGVPAASAGAPAQLAHTNVASSSHEAGSPVTFIAEGPPVTALVLGTNVLAVQAFNVSLSGSSDFRFELSMMLARLDEIAPEVASHQPLGPELGSLNLVTVVFSEPVLGVQATDLRINDQPAATVAGGAGSDTYTFTFTQPAPGLVDIAWSESQRIVDRQGNPFSTEAPGSTWSYTLADSAPPVIREQTPVAGALVTRLSQVEITFSEPVTGVEATDLEVSGQPALGVSGVDAGPYLFEFSEPTAGAVQFAWAATHGIADVSPGANPFGGGSWTVTLNPAVTNGSVRLNEFAAANESGLADEDAEAEDWIEIYNAGSVAVNLLGWSLTDDGDVPGKWTFPSSVLNPGAYLVVFASGKDRRAPTGSNRFHTNFRLNAFGEYLALFNAESPRGVVSEFAPEYPEQRNNHSYGLGAGDTWVHFATPTPGGLNGTSALVGIAPQPHFNIGRGLFDLPFYVTLTTPLEGATLRYTTDGSDPGLGGGLAYTQPIRVGATTTLRAATFQTGYLPSRTRTESYLFLDTVISQPANPPGFPSTWGTWSGFPNNLVPADYEMDLDPLRTDPDNPVSAVDPAKLQRLKNGLRQLPVVSVVMDPDDLFGTGGLYPSASDANKTPNEKACSVEMILPDGSTAFVVQGGLDLHGNASRSPLKNPKHGFKLSLKGDYGETTLNYRLFLDSPAERFDDLLLRADFNSSWRHWSDVANNGNGAFQRSRGTRTRYAWSQETLRELGHIGPHTRFFHLFLNGLYWGTYDFGEQPTENFAKTYYGGETVTHDIYDQGALREGTSAAYSAMQGLTSLVSSEQYEQMKRYLDIPEFIDYMLLHFYVGHQDWGANKNWYALRPRVDGAAGTFKYLPWDQECILLEENVNRVPNGGGSTDVPSGLHTRLHDNAEYRLAFADRVFRHLLAPGGALTPEANIERWRKWQALLDEPIVAESCRWGDYRRDVHQYQNGTYQLYTRENQWTAENNRLVNSYFVNRGGVLLGQLRTAGLYPGVEAPLFNQPGGRVPAGFLLTATAPAGTIYITTNGADPRVYGSGAVSPPAVPYAGALTLDRTTTVKARAYSGAIWSALNEATFTVDELGLPLRFTEIMYNPPGGDAFEFIELQNVGATPLDLGGASLRGLDYIFPHGTALAAGAVLVLSSDANPAAFLARYPSVAVFGSFQGSLDNGGERLALVDRQGQTITVVHYDDGNGWPAEADGGGYSIEVIDPRGDPNAPANWRAGSVAFGMPGLPPTAPLRSNVVLNEVMAENLTAVANDGAFPDWIELYNRGTGTVSLAGWSLTDDGNPRKFIFPSEATLAAGNFLVVWCDATTSAPGLHSGFTLGRKGETVSLYDAETNRVDAVSFGLQVGDLSMGRMGEAWQLTQPTPNEVNTSAVLAPASDLVLNEWLANSAAGEVDWLELHNRSATAPAALRGVYVGTDWALSRIASLSFVPANGYVQLFADEQAGADHLEMKLPAAGGSLALHDATGQELDRVTYGPQVPAVSEGRLPDGTGAVTPFPGSASPAAANYRLTYTGPVLNEVLARNQRVTVSPSGSYADWIELFNPGDTAADLGGMGLDLDLDASDRWIFPPGTLLDAGAYLVVWCDGSRSASTNSGAPFNTGFSLPGTSGEVLLLNAIGQPVDCVGYGFQVPDLPIGRSGGVWHLLTAPTPGEANAAPSPLGPVGTLRINEWMAASPEGDDWFEIYNPDEQPVDMAGLFLTDHPSTTGITNTQVAPLSFLGAGDWVRWWADEKPSAGRDHVKFRLDDLGETIRLYDANLTLIDLVDYGVQTAAVSQGRLPDGGTLIVSFPITPSPGESNHLPLTNVVVNEVLTHTDPPLEDAIELHNPTDTPVDIGGWFLSDNARDLVRYRIPDGTVLEPQGFRVFYQGEFGPADGEEDAPPRFSLNSAHGDAVYLSEADTAGRLTGYRDGVTLGAAANGVSFGRCPTSVGMDFAALRARTFGVDAPTDLAEFRTGAGLSNAPALVGPIVISELMYHPPDAGGASGESPDLEYIELLNLAADAVALFDPAHPTNRWRLANAVSFVVPDATTLPPGGSLVVVPFDPVTDVVSLAAFRAAYGETGPLVGPWMGKLDNAGESVELYRPDTPQGPGHGDEGFVPYVLADRVAYSSVSPWPTNAAGTDRSLHRLVPADYGNDPANWTADVPSPGEPAPVLDTDGDQLPDDWEVAHGTDRLVADAEEDPDQDGLTNLQEYLAGTDPQAASSALRLRVTGVGPTEVTLEFPAIAHHSYSVLYRDTLEAGSWIRLTNTSAETTDRLVPIIDLTPSPTGRYYRLVTPAWPAP